MLKHWLLPAALVASLSMAASPADAAIQYDQNVTNNAIFGSGNANGGFTTDRANGVELGLRAKIRFPVPQNTFLSNGDGTYGSFAPGGFGAGLDRASWSFEWSINTDYNNTTGYDLNDLTYQLRLDTDTGLSTSFYVFDPINGNNPFGTHYWDHSIGNNATASGAGVEAPLGDVAAYEALLANPNYNLAQNSWQYNFFPTWLPSFDPNSDGFYTIQLAAFNGNQLLAQTSIKVLVGAPVPEPATCLIWTGLAGCIAVAARRRKKSAA